MFVFAPSGVWSIAERVGNNLPRVFVQTIAENDFLFTALGVLYVAMASIIDSRDALQRATFAESQAQKAQLQALRYQLDPHFLFNALNTISALVMEGEAEKAEQALSSLSAVLRTTLASDALVDTTLSLPPAAALTASWHAGANSAKPASASVRRATFLVAVCAVGDAQSAEEPRTRPAV